MTVEVNIDDRILYQFYTLCDKLGMDSSTALSIFINKAVRVRGLPFDLTLDPSEDLDDPFYSPENMERLEKAVKALEAGKGVIHEVNYDD